MPSFEHTGEVTVTVEFEVFCGTCGAGLCNRSETGKTNRRQQLFVSVEACEKCLEKAREDSHSDGYHSRDDEAESLNDAIVNLEDRIRELESELKGMQNG
jgi:hypothetical protein